MITGHEELAIRCLCQFGIHPFQEKGITTLHFRDPVYREMFEWGSERLMDGEGLTPAGMEARFESYRHEDVSEEDVSVVTEILIDKKLRRSLAIEMDKTVTLAQNRGNIVPVIESLGQTIQDMLGQVASASLVDAFSMEEEGAGKICLDEFIGRMDGTGTGIPSGLNRFDNVAGGFQKQELVSIIGRTGRGKSWIGVKIIQAALKAGCKIVYYPLEMNLTAVMFRLHAFLAHDMDYGITNRDLSKGRGDHRDYKELLEECYKKYEGQLKILDIGKIREEYTIGRIDSDCSLEKPDLIMVDYLTLLRPEAEARAEDYVMVRQLSNGLKLIAVKHNLCSIAVAQVNRAGAGKQEGGELLPRLEHISFGDALGADSDKVISINKAEDALYYGLIKNRSGEGFLSTKMDFHVNEGILDEISTGTSREEEIDGQFWDDEAQKVKEDEEGDEEEL